VTPRTPADVQSIFGGALEIESSVDRAAYLDKACGPDASLRAEVEGLLGALSRAGEFMRRPVASAAVEATADEQPLTESPGAVIGPYKLLQQIGEGGMGIVYMAEQEQPIRRRVALKIIKPGMDSTQVIARFEAERQALALMDHQNIAKVLDAGTTDSGRPYFVMELVHGVPITQYCDDHQLTPRQRLELFMPVCQAVQHAHQKGIIHRDLKPSNVLVCLYDGVPVPKVIDFGVAKATGQQLTERTMFTQFGSLVGTLEYMSPEQAEMSQLGIDTRSDVYSMGVMLYELLTGTTPLERHRLREAGFDEIRRLIREEEPPKPSTRLSTSGVALAAISAQRQTEPAKLTRLVRGELDWIVMKALEKDRNRRYESANGLAKDVERYLHDEPVEACPPTTGYKLRKFARKHKTGLATAAGFLVLLLIGTAVSAWQAVRAQANENKANAHAAQAEQKEQEAKNERDQVRALNDQLQRTLYVSDMNLAQHAWEAGGVGRVVELLQRHRSKPGEIDLRNFEWHYLNRLCHADLFTLQGSGWSVAYSPDGKRLASGSDDAVKVWDAQTGQEFLTIKAPTGGVTSVAFSPDGKRLACAGGSWLKVWDAQTGDELLSLKGHSVSVAFSPDSKRLASSDENETGKVWDAQTGNELLSLKEYCHGMAFSPDGKFLASVGKEGVKVWDAQTGLKLRTMEGRPAEWPQSPQSVVFSPDGKRMASNLADGTVKVWDAQSGQILLTIKANVSVGFSSVAFSPDGKCLASGGIGNWDGAKNDYGGVEVKLWDAQTGHELLSLKGHTKQVDSVAFSPDGKRLASCGDDMTVKVWDAHAPQKPLILKGGAPSVANVTFSGNGKRLESVSVDPSGQQPAEGRVWDTQTGKELRAFKWHSGAVNNVAVSSDGTRFASGSGALWTNPLEPPLEPGQVKVWDAQTGQELLSLKGHAGGVSSVAFSPDGKLVASASIDGTVKLWDGQTGRELISLNDGFWVTSVAFSPDGKRLASASGEVKVWDVQTGQEILSLITGRGTVNCVTFSPDGKRLAGALKDLTVKLWDAQSGQDIVTFKGHASYVRSIAFSPDGKRLVSVADDKTVKVWDAQTGHELITFKGDVRSVAFSPDGHHLAGGSNDGTVTIWDATPLPEKP
jgi:WD40 repeat protein/serine/threonine protein kinase